MVHANQASCLPVGGSTCNSGNRWRVSERGRHYSGADLMSNGNDIANSVGDFAFRGEKCLPHRKTYRCVVMAYWDAAFWRIVQVDQNVQTEIVHDGRIGRPYTSNKDLIAKTAKELILEKRRTLGRPPIPQRGSGNVFSWMVENAIVEFCRDGILKL